MAKAKRSKTGKFKRGGFKRRRNPAGVAVARRRRSSSSAGGMNLFGIPLPGAERILFAGAGALAPELIEMLVEEYAPDFVASEGGRMAVQVGSYVAPPLLALMYSRRAAGDVALGELVNLSLLGGRKMIAEMREATPATAGYIERGSGRSIAGYISSGAVVNGGSLNGYISNRRMRGYHTSPERMAKRYPGNNYR